jgi:NAD(P)-dependent dehydrogenase (short-subunit alcohol dehydrogenase family)
VTVCHDELRGRRALVVGASGGIGAAVAERLGHSGADVALAARSVEALERQAPRVACNGNRVFCVSFDMTDEESVDAGVDRAAANLGGLDIVVNCAGVSPVFKRTEDTSVEEWDTVFSTNSRGAFLLARAVSHHMFKSKNGVFIFITSVHDDVGLERLGAYAASKGAVRMLARVLALEWAPKGVRVNVVAPGYVETDMTAGIRNNRGLRHSIERNIPLGRMARPEEVASAVAYMASDGAAYMTGSTLYIDGGWTAR